jgi:hypothetical protein
MDQAGVFAEGHVLAPREPDRLMQRGLVSR